MKSFFSRGFLAMQLALVLIVGACAFAPVAQAGALSDYLENKLTDHVFRGVAYTAPTTIYVALFTSACSDAAAGTEVSGGSYARPGLAASTTNWAATNGATTTTNPSTGTGGTTSNNVAITFATPSVGWGTVTYIGLMDAVSAGNLLVCTALTTSKTINSGDTVSFPISSLTNQIDN